MQYQRTAGGLSEERRESRYRAFFIDQGYCFHAGDWKFIDASLGGVFAENTVYRSVTGWDELRALD